MSSSTSSSRLDLGAFASPNDDKAAESVKVVEWEDLQQELARLWSLSSALKKAKERKDLLSQKLESLIQVRSESLHQSNELEEMRQKLETQKLVMGNLLIHSKSTSEDVRNQNKQLCLSIRSLLGAGKALAVAYNQLQEANRLLAGERGHVHLKNFQKLLRMRQQYMMAQVSALYPVKASLGQTPGGKYDSRSDGSKSGDGAGSSSSVILESRNPGKSSLTILGLQLTVPPLKKISFFSDKKEIQRSATALGYVAHAVLLIASYLDVPLRYPLHLGGSCSYIFDHASPLESTSDLVSNPIAGPNMKPTEFPLFLEGQDTTRAAYAMFLLNKDLEQLLNYIGIQSLGPRHVLANLRELLRTIQSQEFVDK
ncbi:vacuolar protein sorting 38-like isoform X1 [Magnolia sinica]|uniref:vacuolar protein sorting 38-like isoform X1 n=1 Tax=Magnolia sinica TaxID=86752 RepID=UPI002658987C|nr:vacuolar protein sorting 38-like isoform X1 [Magnolia sinica]